MVMVRSTILLELLTKLVFFGRYRSVFLNISHTETDGKLGRYISVSKRGNCPLFSTKGGQWPPFEEHSPPFEEKRGERYKKGGTISTKNTDTEPI